jgi:DNA-binding NarL/FixJ family response regulator
MFPGMFTYASSCIEMQRWPFARSQWVKVLVPGTLGGLRREKMGRASILIVDDHEIFRKGLRSLLEPRAEFQICGEAANGLEAVEKAKQLLPDVILMDISMPHIDGLQATRIIRSKLPDVQVLILSQHDSPYMLSAALQAGASAYVTKSQVSRCLLAALEGMVRGRPFSWNAEGASDAEQHFGPNEEIKTKPD